MKEIKEVEAVEAVEAVEEVKELSYTPDQVLKIVQNEVFNIDIDGDIDLDLLAYELDYPNTMEKCKTFNISMAEQFGGEGQGDTWYIVYKFIHKETQKEYFIKISGYYDSWNGTDLSDYKFVEPKEITKTIYV